MTLDGPNPFSGLGIFDPRRDELLGELVQQAEYFKELHESIEAKLMEPPIEQIIEEAEGHPHPGVWAAYIVGRGVAGDFVNTYSAIALDDPSIRAGFDNMGGPAPIIPFDRLFDPQIVRYKVKIEFPQVILSPKAFPNYDFVVDTYCEIVKAYKATIGQGACRIAPSFHPRDYQCLDAVECQAAGGTFLEDAICFSVELNIKAFEKPLDPVPCPDIAIPPGSAMSQLRVPLSVGIEALRSQMPGHVDAQ